MLTENLSLYLGTFMAWGFLMAFLLNLFFRCISVKTDNLLVAASFFISMYYLIGDHFHQLFDFAETYLKWFFYDVITIGLILFVHILTRSKASPGVVYVYVGLYFNAFLFLSMFIDIVLIENKERWFLWWVYEVGVNISDFCMIVALIIDRDFLGVIKVYRRAAKFLLGERSEKLEHP